MMRFAVFAVLACLAGASFADDVIRLSEPVAVTDDYEVFGSVVEDMADPVRLSDVVANEGDFAGKEIAVAARVDKVCRKKGCFFIAQDGDAVARITFVDYSFFVPTDSGGKDVTIVGTFDRKEISEKQAKHYAKDMGENPEAVEGPRFEYAIVARSVIIPKS
jgi:hypothetical protein